ncbi:DNA-processing protein DprA [Streptomonospora halotolerans]|nr:DNA-processing protein DprA [Streptomonospora nanhaiensis]
MPATTRCGRPRGSAVASPIASAPAERAQGGDRGGGAREHERASGSDFHAPADAASNGGDPPAADTPAVGVSAGEDTEPLPTGRPDRSAGEPRPPGPEAGAPPGKGGSAGARSPAPAASVRLRADSADPTPGQGSTASTDGGGADGALDDADDQDGAAGDPPSAFDRSDDALARACLTAVANAGDPVMGALLDEHGAAAVWEALAAGRPPSAPPGVRTAAYEQRAARWAERAARVDPDSLLAESAELGCRLLVPGDPGWPTQLDDLHLHRPYALWVRGAHDLRHACLRSVAVVGARAASAYGRHVAADLAWGLAQRSWTVVSGGAYGIDSAAHRGGLAAGAPSVAVLACGLDLVYPRGNENLFADIAARGALVSEHPRGAVPSRHGFLIRNRIIAALTPGAVVVEAGLRSGALNTARHAHELNRTVMAVPGPVTSALSAGCHRLIRDSGATCVTSADDVMEQVGRIGTDLAPAPGSALDPDTLDPESRRVLAEVPRRGGTGTAAVAAACGLDLDSALSRLGLLAAAGFVERGPSGWRTRDDRPARRPAPSGR